MPLIQYKEFKFKSATIDIIYKANKIIAEYSAEGYSLTLRQLYYQFVARGYIENSLKEYKNLGNIINDARLNGDIDWEAIEDRTRNLEALPTWFTEKEFLKEIPDWFRFDFWDTQEYRIEIWVEKEALTGVVARTAHKYRVPYFACRGYTSQSESWRVGIRFADYNDKCQKVIVLHLGDHDPSGIDMTRDNRERLRMFSNFGDVEVIRVALNRDQVDQYNPPPNPAKLTDRRATKYINRHGLSSWELDALNPRVIDGLISHHIEQYIDWEAWDEVKEKEDASIKAFKDMAKAWKDSHESSQD